MTVQIKILVIFLNDSGYLPFALIGSLRRLCQFGSGSGKTLLGSLEVLL